MIVTCFALLTAVASVAAAVSCPDTPAFVDPTTLLDTTSGNKAVVANNKLLLAVRYGTNQPSLVETKNNGAATIGSAQSCFTFPHASGATGTWTFVTQTRPDGCKVDVYSMNLATYLTSPAPANGFGCGSSSTSSGGVATTLGNFNIFFDDAATVGRAPTDQVVFENPVTVKMVTPLSFTQPLAITADATGAIDPTSVAVSALFTRSGLTSAGSLMLTWSLSTTGNFKNLRYSNTNPLTMPSAFAIGAENVQLVGVAPTNAWSGTVAVPITNFCSGVSDPAGTYTLSFKAATGSSTNFNTDAAVSFVFPSGDLCGSFIPTVPSLSVSLQDGNSNPVTGHLQIGNTYQFIARVSSIYTIASASFAAFPNTEMVTPASGAVTTTYNILPGSNFFTNQAMGATTSFDAAGATLTLFFTVNDGPVGDNPADWFFLSNELPATGTISKTFLATFKVNVQYADAQLNTLSRRDNTMEIVNYASANSTFSVTGKMPASSGAMSSLTRMSSFKMWAAVIVVVMATLAF